ncbi:MAG: hypothetical protein R3B07_29360 [Polyangiaceae bacterium]
MLLSHPTPLRVAMSGLVAASAFAAFACSSNDTENPSSGAAGAAGAETGGASAAGAGSTNGGAQSGGTGASAGTGGACAQVPEGVPPCWLRQEYPPGIGNCDVYYPGPKAEMPAPMVWDDVDLPTIPPVKARVMNRETPDGKFDAGAFNYGWYDAANSRVLLAFNRTVPSIDPRHRILAEADGAVLNAALSVHPKNKTCEVGSKSLAPGRFLLNVLPVVEGSYEGALAWPLGSKLAPKTIYIEGARPSSFFASDDYIVRWANGVFVRSWDSDTETNVLPPTDSSLLISNVFARDDAVFTTVTDDAPGTQMWRESTGSVPFVRFDAASPRGASNLATDGRDWVWTEGTRANGGWENFELFTSPYSLDPAEVRAKARRVHSEPTGWASATYAPTVGCGYRARVHITDNYEVHVTRLSDGHRWILRSPDSTQVPFSLGPTLAISCDEVFIQAEPGMLVRIRLSDLGPGQPAD